VLEKNIISSTFAIAKYKNSDRIFFCEQVKRIA